MEFRPDKELHDRFLTWIESFGSQPARNWPLLYKDSPEAAMCEATFWELMTNCGVDIAPQWDSLGMQTGPDFVCTKDGQKFYLEVTCLLKDRVTKETGLADVPDKEIGVQGFGDLNNAFFNEMKNKTPQCAHLDAPCILGLGTFHVQASSLCCQRQTLESLLTGKQLISQKVDTRTGSPVGDVYMSTQLESAAFIRPGGDAVVEYARSPISAILIGGFGITPPSIHGLIHPKPARQFDRALLSRIEFCRLKPDSPPGKLAVEWI